MKTTNYINTFIEVAEDCPVAEGEIPQAKGDKITVASYQFDMIIAHPYKYTSDDIIFNQYADKEGLAGQARKDARTEYFQKGRACLRASPLGKRYGWGIHYDEQGRIAIYAKGTPEYDCFRNDPALEHTKAMRSKKA
ncbi:DUF6157 family protein [Chitinophaga caseinilytica]|uniref:DUF6157 family protein n=1 Tax=Chitinophaga caseinilytica TaxID=2267521 RepID=A0ABZ2Z0B4_9BACT